MKLDGYHRLDDHCAAIYDRMRHGELITVSKVYRLYHV